MNENRETSGVEELIQRLREQGVESGQRNADELLEQARRAAEGRLNDARREAENILSMAREEASQTKNAGKEAVQLAVRDGILSLKAELAEHFGDRIRRLVTRELENKDFLKQVILEVAGRAAPPQDRSAEILLPSEFVGLEQLRRNPEDAKEGTLSHFVVTVTKAILREGIGIGVRDDDMAGIRIRLTEDDLEIDLTDRAVTDLLLRHLAPRFRALMEGIIQ